MEWFIQWVHWYTVILFEAMSHALFDNTPNGHQTNIDEYGYYVLLWLILDMFKMCLVPCHITIGIYNCSGLRFYIYRERHVCIWIYFPNHKSMKPPLSHSKHVEPSCCVHLEEVIHTIRYCIPYWQLGVNAFWSISPGLLDKSVSMHLCIFCIEGV